MTDGQSTGGESDHEEALGRLTDALAQESDLAQGVDETEWAERFGVGAEDVARCLDAVRAMKGISAVGRPPRDELPPPTLPDDYELLGEIGRGGMGVVYRVRQKSLDRMLALKVLRPGDIVFGDALRRFRKEARSLARLRHPHLVSVHEVGETDGHVYYTMDLVEGDSLAALVARKEVTPTRAVRILREITSAIAYVHEQGLIHRDLKPANVLIDREGRGFVVDFGLARDADASAPAAIGPVAGRTLTGQLLGTPAYMSPEQARGDGARVGEASDIYGLGAILYECLAGRPPFSSASLADLVHAVVHLDPTPPRRIDPKVPPDLELIASKAMAKEPERRYATARALLDDLERFEDGRPIRARPDGAGYRIARTWARHRATVMMATVIVILLGVSLVRGGGHAASVEPLLKAALDLRNDGHSQVAVGLLERALAEDPPAEVADRLRAAWIACRIDVARGPTGGLAGSESLAILEQTEARWRTEFESQPPGVDLRIAQEALRVARITGDAVAESRLRAAVAARQETMLSTRRKLTDGGIESLDFTPPQADTATPVGTLRELLQSRGDALADDVDRVSDGDVTRLAIALTSEPLGEMPEWLAAHPRAARSLLLAIAARPAPRSAVFDAARWSIGLLDDLASVFGDDDFQAKAAALAESHDIGHVGRAAALRMLAVAADLPMQPPWGRRGHQVDEVQARAILDGWRSLRGLSRSDALRRRIHLFLEHAPLDGDPSWMSQWIEEHSAGRLSAAWAGKNDDRVALLAAWARMGSSDPADWFASALGLDSVAARDRVRLASLLRTETGSRRVWVHHLLCLATPHGEPVAARRVGSADDDALVERWASLRGVGFQEPLRVRLAEISWSDASESPALRFDESGLLWMSEDLALTGVVHPLPAGLSAARRTAFGQPPQVSVAGVVARAVRDVDGLRVQLAPLDPQRSALRLSSVRVGDVVSTGARFWAMGHSDRGPSFLVVEDGAAVDPPASVTRWQHAVAAAVTARAAELRHAHACGDRFRQARAMEASWQLCRVLIVLPVAEAAPGLRGLWDTLEPLIGSGPPQLVASATRFTQFVSVARLRCGDASVFDRPGITPAAIASVIHDPDRRFLVRVVLEGHSDAGRAFAASAFAPERLPDELRFTLGRAIGEGRVPDAASGLRALVMPARLHQFFACSTLEAGLLGLLVLAAFGAAVVPAARGSRALAAGITLIAAAFFWKLDPHVRFSAVGVCTLSAVAAAATLRQTGVVLRWWCWSSPVAFIVALGVAVGSVVVSSAEAWLVAAGAIFSIGVLSQALVAAAVMGADGRRARARVLVAIGALGIMATLVVWVIGPATSESPSGARAAARAIGEITQSVLFETVVILATTAVAQAAGLGSRTLAGAPVETSELRKKLLAHGQKL